MLSSHLNNSDKSDFLNLVFVPLDEKPQGPPSLMETSETPQDSSTSERAIWRNMGDFACLPEKLLMGWGHALSVLTEIISSSWSYGGG